MIDRKCMHLVCIFVHRVVGKFAFWCLLEQADYYALGNRSHAYTVIAPAVAQYVTFFIDLSVYFCYCFFLCCCIISSWGVE
jgi:hypothetical protein